MPRILDQAHRVTAPAERNGRAAHHRAVPRRPAARVLPDLEGGVGPARAAPGTKQHLVGLATDPAAALFKPAEQALKVGVGLELALEQALGELDRLGHVVVPGQAGLARRDLAYAVRGKLPNPGGRITFDRRAQRVPDGKPDERPAVAVAAGLIG